MAWLWITLQRPPLKTMGETRIWYAFFLAILGGITYWRWKINYLLTFTNLLASVFVLINIFKPEIQSQALMPALQSVWFIPHVAIYMFAYAVIGCAVVLGIFEMITLKKQEPLTAKAQSFFAKVAKKKFLTFKILRSLRKPFASLAVKKTSKFTKKIDLLIKIGTVALGIGMCMGALWAKKAWGQYWSWDIKETAALITWAIFLLYIHLQKIKKINRKILLIILLIGFLSLQFTWYGVKCLPTAQKSPHTFYSIE
jgi:ABC-type transport system involved in cytochrome c biogenesis permease subunit